jgi:hypothetical protein
MRCSALVLECVLVELLVESVPGKERDRGACSFKGLEEERLLRL